MKTSVIIPIYFNNIELYPIINNCIESYKKRKDWELILIDDASPLCTDEWPITEKLPENLQYTGAVCRGVALSKGDNIWIVNDDIIFNDKVCRKMQDIKENTIYTPMWGGDSFEDKKFGFFYGMTRKTWDKLGGLDKTMKLYFSDLDLYTRANEMGIKIIKWKTVVLHIGGATCGGNQQLFLRDQEIYRNKHGRVD